MFTLIPLPCRHLCHGLGVADDLAVAGRLAHPAHEPRRSGGAEIPRAVLASSAARGHRLHAVHLRRAWLVPADRSRRAAGGGAVWPLLLVVAWWCWGRPRGQEGAPASSLAAD
ncbi:hypothetical protein ACU4GD_29480 [Cupriavidus basilensis]